MRLLKEMNDLFTGFVRKFTLGAISSVTCLSPTVSLAQSDVYMSGWQPQAARMQCINLSTPLDNGIPAVAPLLPACMEENLRERFEGEFKKIANWLEKGGLHNPDYLRPVVPVGSDRTLLLYVSPARTDYASYSSPCLNNVPTPGTNGVITFNNDPGLLNQAGVPSGVLVHEMTHAAQFASGFARRDVRFCAGTTQTPVLNWIREGTADALAWEYVRTELKNEWNVLISSGSKLWKRAAGLRPYDFPLQFREANSDNDDSFLYRKHQNYVSAFWRQLAWRYHDGDIFYVRKLFDTQINPPHDWTSWANKILKNNPDTKHGFYTTYPTFIADWASMNTSDKFKSAGISNAAWRKAMFTGCPIISLRKGHTHGVTLKLKQLAAKCIQLRIDDLKDGEIGTVRIYGRASGAAPVEEFHLSEIERISADSRRCSEILDAIIDIGDKPIPGNDCVVYRTLPKGQPGVATFAPGPLYGSAKDDTIVFAVSRVKMNPGDADVDASAKPEGFRLTVSVDYSVAALGNAGPKPAQVAFFDSRVWSNASLPIDISHQTLAAQEGKMRGPAAGLGGIQTPITLEAFTGINPAGQGAWSISLETFDVTSDQSPYGRSLSYEPKDTLTFHLKESTTLVQGQSYEAFAAYRRKFTKPEGITGSNQSIGSLFGAITGALTNVVSGNGSSPPKGSNDFEPTILTVVERSDNRITVNFNGRLCMGAGMMAGSRGRSAANCLSIEPVSGTFSIAYPELYSMDGLLRYDQESEGNRVYRDQIAAQFNRVMSRAFGSGTPGAASASQPGQGTSSTSHDSAAPSTRATINEPCDCSCEALERFRNMGKNPKASRSNFKIGCVLRCAKQFAACEN